MSTGYTTGGDALYPLAKGKRAGQTFRITQPHTLKWIDLNMRIWGLFPEPKVSIYYADAHHLPFGDPISASRCWLPDISFTPREWDFFETWGKTLTANHPWLLLPEHTPPITNLSASTITLTSIAYESKGMRLDFPDSEHLLIDSRGRHLLFVASFAETQGDPLTHSTRLFLFTQNHEDSFHIRLIIARGHIWAIYGENISTTGSIGTFDYGQGRQFLDLHDLWKQLRALGGFPIDPTGWTLQYIRLEMLNEPEVGTILIKNNYLALSYQAYEPAPRDDYTIIKKGFKWPGQTYRVRFPMLDLLLSTDTYYFMQLTSSPGIFDIPPEWQYDEADASYPAGVRLSKESIDDPWVVHPNDDHIFVEFGTPPLPPPPPDPPVPNFAILDLYYYPRPTGFGFQVKTCTPCHLYMFWTNKEPDKHLQPVLRRGIRVKDILRYCFVAWNQNEQEEEGDTITHTFYKDDWPVCETRWYAFRGTINDEWAPSITSVWQLHRTGREYQLIIREPWTS